MTSAVPNCGTLATHDVVPHKRLIINQWSNNLPRSSPALSLGLCGRGQEFFPLPLKAAAQPQALPLFHPRCHGSVFVRSSRLPFRVHRRFENQVGPPERATTPSVPAQASRAHTLVAVGGRHRLPSTQKAVCIEAVHPEIDAAQLKTFRKERGLSQERLCEEASVSYHMVYRIESR